MPERDANQLAADVRNDIEHFYAGNHSDTRRHRRDRSFAALDELVDLVGTLQQERDDALSDLENYAQQVAADHYFARAEAAEAALAAKDAELIAANEERRVSDEAAATWARLLAEEQIALATTRQALTDALRARPEETEARDTYADGYTGGLIRALQIVADTGGDTA